jgi:LmbE family N-acetylglucosaminyl deacetylase
MPDPPASDAITPSLLAVFAHPDDESIACGGVLAWCAAHGIRASLLCLTRGGIGQLDDPARIRMGEARRSELEAAGHVLGLHEVILLDHRNGFLPWVERGDLEADIQKAIRASSATVVITFDDDGLYWHPDHIAVHERTTAAVAAMGDEAPALFYVSIPKGAMRAVWRAAADAGSRADGGGPVPPVALGVEVDAYGLFSKPPTVRVDTGACALRKLQALRCHRSQIAGDALDRLPEAAAARTLGVELYRRASVGRRGDTFLDHLGTAM